MDPELSAASDETLVERIVSRGSENASVEIFRRYKKKIYLWSYSYTRDAEEAEDCAQAIFIKIFENLSGFAGRSKFSTWVYGIARNHCLGELTRASTRWRRGAVPIEDLDLEDESCAERLRRAEISGELERLLSRAARVMEADEIEAFVLHYRERLSVGEITRTLGCANTTGARALIQSARRKFRRMRREE